MKKIKKFILQRLMELAQRQKQKIEELIQKLEGLIQKLEKLVQRPCTGDPVKLWKVWQLLDMRDPVLICLILLLLIFAAMKVKVVAYKHALPKLKAKRIILKMNFKGEEGTYTAKRFIKAVSWIFPKAVREELYGDTLEALSTLEKEGYSRLTIWSVAIFKVLLLIWASLKIKISDFFPAENPNIHD